MCSICGILDFKTQNIDEKVVKSMNNSLNHRGPDQQGIFLTENIAFAHNRLAVIDVENGLQPMTRVHKGKSYTIIYNGEIYNSQELTNEIKRYGINLTTTCDTEVVLYAYILFGEKCSKLLNGIFAFAILDDDKVYLSRDRFGVKPFYYAQKNSKLFFASEPKAILKNPEIKPIIDKQGLWQLLFLTPAKMIGSSVFRDILEIPPAHHGYFDGENLRLECYFELKAEIFTGSERDAVEHTKFLVTDAIKRQLVSDVPLCTFLSGGIDSSIITSVAQEEYLKKGEILSTYSFEYKGNKQNFQNTMFQPDPDDDYAVYLASYLGTNHEILQASTEDIIYLLESATKARDLPGMADIDSSLLYYCKKVKKRHTVALSGECADEIFGGYPWFYRSEMLDSDFFPWIHAPLKRVNLFREDKVFAKEGYEFMSNYYKSDLEKCPILENDSHTMKTSRRATWLSTRFFMSSLLERKDRMSMWSGVEVRVPFSDHRILEYVYNVPWEYKFKNGVEKSLLRDALSDYLPEKILKRKKSPYPKTHDPMYEEIVTNILKKRLKYSYLNEILDLNSLKHFLNSENSTWFGQLMSKPQLISWLIQMDYFLESNDVIFE